MNLYRVNYSYVAANGQLRQGAIVTEAPDLAGAEVAGLAMVPASQKHPKVTTVALYSQNKPTTNAKK